MKKHILFILLALAGITAQAQAPAGYYNNANGKTGTELRQALHDIINNHNTISYDNIWDAFPYTDHRTDNVNKVWDIYSDIPGGTPKLFTFGDNQCGTYSQEGDCYNREHSWPQSWFNSANTPSSDLHHIFPTDGYVNNRRGNNPYGEVSSPTYTSHNGSKLGTCTTSGYSGTVFEPIDEYKGDIARAYFYISVRYYGEDSDWSTSGMTNKSEILPWAMTMLLQWNDQDPVSQKEIDRNNVIYNNYQHNRNPFIDNPEYAHMIWDPNWTPSTPTGGDYVKVTSTEELEDGDYLIVCENNNVAFNGALTTLDAVSNTINVSISNSTIAQSGAMDAATFTITAKTGGGYSIKSASGLFIGNDADANNLKSSSTDIYTNSISITNGTADIVSSSSHLRYNPTDGQTRFRYYKSGTYTNQQAIQLYKKTEAPTTYIITLAAVANGTISADMEEATEGTTITLTATPAAGYEFSLWTVTDANNNVIAVTNNQFEMPASNVTVSASFEYVGLFEQKYYLVTSTDQLVAGRTYLIVNTDAQKALSTTQNSNNRSAVSVNISGGAINSIGNTVCELTLGGTSGAWTFYDATNNGYLYAASSDNNYLKTQTNNNANGQWSISIASNGAATIIAQGSNTRNHLRYNTSGIFSCYASTASTTQMPLAALFIRSEEYPHPQDETIANLFPFDKHVIASGATLTVTGTATCTDPSLLVIEEGGQLIHHTDGVKATLKKTIQAYSDGESDGWYTIAAPFSNFNPTEIATGTYDLYYYDEDATEEWINYKSHQAGFAQPSTSGYLYAHSPSTTLRMTGTLNNGNYSETVNLSYGNSNASIKGYNLLGNPTAHDIVFNKTDNVSDGYYYLNNSEEWQYETSNSVPVGRGFLVKANAANQSVTLNPQSKDTRDEKGEYVVIDIDGDKAYVKTNDGVSMPLLSFRGHQPSLWLEREGQPYIMMVRDGADIVELNYKAKEHGIHTLKVYSFHSQLSTLHLIDRLTGADIDLLKNPNYQFESSSSDYKARFLLVFNPNDAGDNDDFAFIDADGNLIVNGDGLLQVYDVLGHQLFSSDVHSAFRIPHSAFPTSVYILRLTTPEKTRIQKIIIN